jgi:hypothetical protein
LWRIGRNGTTPKSSIRITPFRQPRLVMRKEYKMAIGITAAFCICAMAVVYANASGAFTGLFFKAYDKTLSPGEQYERNITVRKYYNMSVRFQKEGSTSYLTFSDNGSVIVFKDAAGSEVVRLYGIKNGHSYLKVSKEQLDSISTVSAYNVSSYSDMSDQSVNQSSVSFSGTTAYVNVKVRFGPASLSGYVFDDLTGDAVHDIVVAAFNDGANASIGQPLSQGLTDSGGKYSIGFDLGDDLALDVYVQGYDVV